MLGGQRKSIGKNERDTNTARGRENNITATYICTCTCSFHMVIASCIYGTCKF